MNGFLTSFIVQLRIWDFSGQTTLFFTNEKNKFLKDCQRQSDHDVSCTSVWLHFCLVYLLCTESFCIFDTMYLYSTLFYLWKCTLAVLYSLHLGTCHRVFKQTVIDICKIPLVKIDRYPSKQLGWNDFRVT